MKIDVNGIELFYEKEGSGPPLILLHGNGEDHHIFDEAAAVLAKTWTLYRIDSRGHGQSSRMEELHYEDLAGDVISLVQALGLERPLLYGFSDGGIIGLLIALRAPRLLSGMIISGANLQPRGMKGLFYWMFRILNLFRRKPEWEMMLTEPSIRKGDLRTIEIPVYVTAGERDMIRESHTTFIAEHIPKSKLDILEGQNHGSYVVHTEKLARIIEAGAAFIQKAEQNANL
ncbi:alpha/beta hydrolase [Clostridiales bacterium]|nr:alpha/beta hydrolase [Clostridiales bacterium]